MFIAIYGDEREIIMDEFFDKLKDGASKAKDAAERLAKEVTKRTSNAITSTKLSYSINEANNKAEDIFAKIGKAIYENRIAEIGEDIDFSSEFETIDAIMQDIENLKAKKAELKNAVMCAECGTLNPIESEYCSKCGAQLFTADEDADTVDDDDIEVEEITIIPEQKQED